MVLLLELRENEMIRYVSSGLTPSLLIKLICNYYVIYSLLNLIVYFQSLEKVEERITC